MSNAQAGPNNVKTRIIMIPHLKELELGPGFKKVEIGVK